MTDKLISSFNIINTLVHKYGRDCGTAVLEIDEQPEAVVRCKDCKFYREDVKWCKRIGLVFGLYNENDFCSYGERK